MKKITIELNQFKKLGRMCDFSLANRDRFEAGTPAAEALPMMTSTIGNLKELTASQASSENRLRELSRLKAAARSTLNAVVESIYHTASGIAAETPGFDDKFQMSLKGDPKLLNAARSALRDAASSPGAFVNHAMPPDFLVRLEASIQNFERARQDYETQKAACSAGAAALKLSMEKALAAARRFDAIIRNTFREDSVTLDAWKRICRIPRVPRTKSSEEPSPQIQADTA